MKEEIFSKFKDYNRELEKILEKKDFSKDAKNLLLSMFYKLENSYNDYQTVKRKVKSKQEYLENILDNIKQCNKIELIHPNMQEFKDFKEKKIDYEVNLKLKYIKVIDNELFLLSALLELNDFRIYLDEQYNLIRNSFPYLLNSGSDMDNIEVLRDFNAFSWNTSIEDMKNIPINLLYENLKMALSIDIIQKLISTNENIDVISLIKENLYKEYGEKISDSFLKLLFQASIIIYIHQSSGERKRLLDEKKVIEEELCHIKDKQGYINSIIHLKMELSQRVKELDLILNNKELLMQEYERRNKSTSNYHRIFNLSHLTEKIQRERMKLLNRIEECNTKLQPKMYIENKHKLQENYNLLKSINFDDGYDNAKLLYQIIDKIQLLFLKEILPKKIEKLNTKEEMIDFLYQLRYYQFIPYSQEKEIRQVAKLKDENNQLLSLMIKRMYQFKYINTMSTNEENDIFIVKNIFFLRVISLEEIYLLLKKIENTNYELSIYDDKENLEKRIEMNLKFYKRDRVKLKRKVKIFKN